MIAVAASCLRTEPSRWGSLERPLAWIQGNAWWLLLGLGLVVPVLEITKRRLGNPWNWEVVHGLLSLLREVAFSDRIKAGDAEPDHRATLFRRARCLLPAGREWLSHWLELIERSGFTTRATKRKFYAPDDRDLAEGVAGQTWVENRLLSVEDLPDLGPESTEAELKSYAARSFVSEEWVRKRRPRSRSYYGIPVEVKGSLWGVVVVDSRQPRAFPEGDQRKRLFETYQRVGRVLSKALEEP